MQERVFEKTNIQIYWNTEVQEVHGDVEVSGGRLLKNTTKEEREIALAGLFIAIGHQPTTQLFRDYLGLDDQEYIVIDPGGSHTGVENIFACGDVADKVYRQAVTAAGAGCRAALDAERYLNQMDRK